MAELKKKPIMLLTGYFDESGITENEDACAIAGFIGSGDAHLRLKKKWDEVLATFNIQHFHALDFYAKPEHIAESKSNPYRGWSTTKRKRFVAALFVAMKDSGVRLKAIGSDAKAFRRRTLEERRWLTGGVPAPMSSKGKWLSQGKPSSPYHMIFRALVENICGDLPSGTKIHFVMSKQDQMQATAIQLYDAIRLAFPECSEHLDEPITFASYKTYVQLQAADLIAFHMRKIASERRTKEAASPTGVNLKIMHLARTSKDAETIDDEVIEILCQSLKARHAKNHKIREDADKDREKGKLSKRNPVTAT